MRQPRRWLVWLTLVALLSTTLGCVPTPVGRSLPERAIKPAETPTPPVEPEPTPARQTAGLTLPADYEATVIAKGLRGPTQMILGPEDGTLWLAQLAGGESDGQGQIVSLAMSSGQQRVLLEGLFKPTGIALLDQALWIAAGRDLLRVPLSETGQLGEIETILSELPFNGRSEGTLTVSPAGRLIFETSGARRGNQAATGSGQLWALDPADPTHPQPLASGLKGAYAHTFDAAGRLWTTDIHDDQVNNEVPPDELNLWLAGADFGWPACFGQQEAALNYGGTAESCQATRPPVAIFPPRSTPVSLVASPWAEDTLLVALWGPTEPAIVQVSYDLSGTNAVGQVEPFISGLQNPQHLLPLPDGTLLVSDFRTGLIYQIRN
jgi:glucose/arabinose dehydrogenase